MLQCQRQLGSGPEPEHSPPACTHAHSSLPATAAVSSCTASTSACRATQKHSSAGPWGRDSYSCYRLSIWDHACRFTFPSAEHLGQSVLSVKDLSHGYQDRRLFDHANMELEKGERVAIMGMACPCGILDWLIEDALVCSHVLVFSRLPPHMAPEKGKRVASMGTPGPSCSTASAGPRAWTGLCTAVSWGMCWTAVIRGSTILPTNSPHRASLPRFAVWQPRCWLAPA